MIINKLIGISLGYIAFGLMYSQGKTDFFDRLDIKNAVNLLRNKPVFMKILDTVFYPIDKTLLNIRMKSLMNDAEFKNMIASLNDDYEEAVVTLDDNCEEE